MELVTVIMPSYNTPYEYLREAVESIKSQSYEMFELLIIDDGSTQYNDLAIWNEIINGDPRIRIIKNENKKGVAGALNTGLSKASGKYIIRMDSDDVSVRDRIMQQVSYMEKHKDVDLLAGYIKCFGASNKVEKSEINDVAMKTTLLFQSGIAHPTVCLRKETIERYNLRYDGNVQSEDYELWTRCAVIKNFKFATLPQIVLHYRIHKGQVSQTRKNIMVEQGKEIRKKYINCLIDNISDEEVETFVDYSMYLRPDISIMRLINLEKKICNEISKRYDVIKDRRECKRTFWKICFKKAASYVKKGRIVNCFPMIISAYNYIAS